MAAAKQEFVAPFAISRRGRTPSPTLTISLRSDSRAGILFGVRRTQQTARTAAVPAVRAKSKPGAGAAWRQDEDMLGGSSRIPSMWIVDAVLSAVLLSGADVCALSSSVRHRGGHSRRCRSSMECPRPRQRFSHASATPSHLENGRLSHPRISVTVNTTVSLSSMHGDETSTSTSTSTSSLGMLRRNTQTKNCRNEPDDGSHAGVSMDTPARKSLPSHSFRLQTVPGKGLGIICRTPISKGDFVGEYKGEVLSEDEKDRRYLPSLAQSRTEEDRRWMKSRTDRGQTLTGCYLYDISLPPNYSTDGRHSTSRIYVDAEDEYKSLWTRFINHATPPGNNVNPKSIYESYDGNPRVWFVANRDIVAGEEICFDYGDDYWLDGDDVL